MKRIWAILLSIAIMMSLTVTAFAATRAVNATNMDMVVSKTELQGKDTLTITLSNSKPVKFDTMTFHIDFDTTKLTCKSVDYTLNDAALSAKQETSPYVGHSTVAEANSTGTAGFYYCKIGTTEGEGVSVAAKGQLVATITFEVKEGIADNATYTVNLTEDSDGYNYFKGIDKSQVLTFKSASAVLVGDVDGNGKVNNKDLTALARYLAKWTGYESINMTNADTTGEGKVNNKDLTTLARYLAKWSGYETLPVA